MGATNEVEKVWPGGYIYIELANNQLAYSAGAVIEGTVHIKCQ